jgi:hypothetical protein
MENVLNDSVQVINDWQSLGALAGIITLLQLLVKVLKLKPIDNVFIKYRIKWIKPFITVTLGALLGGLSTYSTGADIPQSIIAGAFAATASVGWNEVVNKLQSGKREN